MSQRSKEKKHLTRMSAMSVLCSLSVLAVSLAYTVFAVGLGSDETGDDQQAFVSEHRVPVQSVESAAVRTAIVCADKSVESPLMIEAVKMTDSGGEERAEKLTFSALKKPTESENVTADGVEKDEPISLGVEISDVDGVMYVPIEEFALFALPDASVSSDGCTVSVSSCSLTFEGRTGDTYVTANGRCLWCGYGVLMLEGKISAPLDILEKAFGAHAEFSDAALCSVTVGESISDAEEYYDEEDLYWLSHIISAESMSESLNGKIAVGNVVLNRVASEGYPDTVYGVIFDTRSGVQFSPIIGGSVYNDPDPESIIAAKLCLEGVSVSDTILFFMNPDLADTSWISDNRPYVMTIGNHSFYS